MENKSTSSQLPTALRLGNMVTTDKLMIIENFNKHFSTAGHAFRLATPTSANSKCMLFNRSLPAPARPTSITTLDGSDLEYVDIYKYLGVWLDCKLSFQTSPIENQI
jgi:hypothetical protein